MRASVTAALAAAAAVALTACSTSPSGSADGSTRPAPYPSAAAASVPATATGGDPAIERLMVGARDLGRAFVRAQPDAPAALPCTPNDPPVDDQVPHVGKGNAVYVDDLGGVQVSEQVYVYGSAHDAERHQSIDERGLDCARGTMGSTLVTVDGPVDLRGRLGGHCDSAQAWGVRTSRFSGALVAVRVRAVMVQFAIVAETGAKASVDVQRVVRDGVQKVLTVAGSR
jgi:hypothetical protein